MKVIFPFSSVKLRENSVSSVVKFFLHHGVKGVCTELHGQNQAPPGRVESRKKHRAPYFATFFA